MVGTGKAATAEQTWIRRLGPLGALETDWERHYCRNSVECFAETGTFVQEYDDFRIDDGWLYVRVPVEPPEVIDERRRTYNEMALTYLDKGTDHWEAVIRPETVARLATMRRARPRTEKIDALAKHVAACMEEAGRILGHLHWAMVGGFPMNNGFAEAAGCANEETSTYISGYTHETERLVRRLRKLARLQNAGDERFDAEFRKLLARYGRRNGSGYGSSTTFASPTWAMNPDLALDVIRGYARSDLDDGERRERELRRRRRRAFEKLRAGVAASGDEERVRQLDRAYDLAARQIRAMEDHNHLMEQETQGTLRESIHRLGVALVTAGRVDKATDVLSLTLDELHDLPHGDLRETVAERKADRDRRLASPPPTFLGPPPPDRGFTMAASTDAVSHDPLLLVGVAGSPGTATGRAVVAADSYIPPEVEPGDILVARDAGPAWTPVFPLLAGVVLDEGAVFQHAALVAREYGIPAVLGTKKATTSITDGMTITVDGSAGRVKLHA